MLKSMTPKRWLLTTGGCAALYVVFVGATALDGVWNVPQQIHSAVLVTLAVGALLSGLDELMSRREARLLAAILDRQEQTRELPRFRIVGTAAVAPADELDRYAEGLVDGLAKQHSGGGTVIKIDSRKS